jgi:geranylgeranylglycerol-phosphate geranylgeranyltransferase
VYIGAVVSGSARVSPTLLLGMAAVLFVAAGCHPLNDYFDYEVDKVVHPDRPLPKGLFKPITAVYMSLILFLISLVFSALISILCLSLDIIGIGLVLSYELWLKNKGISGNILVAFTAAVSFNYGGAIAGDLLRPTFITLIAFFIFLGREIIMDVRDLEGDRNTRATLPQHIGKERAVYLGSAMITISVILLFFVPLLYSLFHSWFDLLVIPLALFTFYTVSLSIVDVNNVRKTAELLRVVMILGLVFFLSGIFLG